VRLSNAAAENARSERICVTGSKASMPGLFVIIFLGTTMVSPGSSLIFCVNIFLFAFSTSPFALIT